MDIFVDADGCPVVDCTVRLAREHGVACTLLCDTAHHFDRDGAATLIVSKGPDSVDFAIVNRAAPGDLVVTQDYGLAAMCLARGMVVLHPNGMQYSNENIDALLESRYIAKKIRRAGGRLKGPSRRTAEQDKCFEEALILLLKKA